MSPRKLYTIYFKIKARQLGQEDPFAKRHLLPLQLEFPGHAGTGVTCWRQIPTHTYKNPNWLLLMEFLACLFQLDF